MSFHLIEPIVNTSFSGNVATGTQTVPVSSTLGMYPTALLVVGNNTANQEIVTITSVVPNVSFTATFAKTHLANDPIITATFPTQNTGVTAASDPFFTQTEMLAYLARAQNEFLARVPCIQALFTQTVAPNTIYQTTPPTAIEINRVAASTLTSPIVYLRLYERTMETIQALNRNWRTQNQTQLSQWFEDRAGNYQWGVGGNPTPAGSDFPVELVCAIRDSDTLLLTDGFLVPDVILHYVRYQALHYAWSKDGQQSNASLSQYCNSRFERGILATQRWVDGIMTRTSTTGQAQGRRAGGRG